MSRQVARMMLSSSVTDRRFTRGNGIAFLPIDDSAAGQGLVVRGTPSLADYHKVVVGSSGCRGSFGDGERRLARAGIVKGRLNDQNVTVGCGLVPHCPR